MRRIEKVEPMVPRVKLKKKVAAYARVSMETERLMHSLSAQVSHYSKYIQKNPAWEYAGVYSDDGISGTGTKKRKGFQQLIADAEDGKIDIILTKSISRFARNTVDLLETVRHLKDKGIEVRFEREHISSMSSEGELMLTILASFAQEESRSISENCKWGIRKRFQSGEIGAANKHILGYQYDEDLKQYVVIPEEAEIVKRMFRLYLEKVSLRAICDELNDMGYRTINGMLFQEAAINSLLHNEIYAGDIRRQKCYIADPINKTKVKNQGELPQYYMADCHEAIIDRETYALVLQEFERRTAMLNPTYCFTGKIVCGMCGSPYTRKKSKVKGKTYVHWICRAKKEVGRTCKNHNFSEINLKKISVEILELEEFDEDIFTQQIEKITVLADGSLAFKFYEGRTKVWQKA